MKKNRINRFIWTDNDFHLAPANLPADAVARQAMPGFKAGNYLIDEFYRLSRNKPQQYKEILKNRPKIPPSTKLEDLISYYNDIKAEENLAFIRVECGSNKYEMFRYLQKKRREIDKRYEPLLNPTDCYSFGGLSELMNFLCSTSLFLTKEIINRTLHEQKHSNEAIKRGYKIDCYQCWLCLNKNDKPDYLSITRIKTSKFPSEKDYRAITAAPKDPSIIDLLSIPITPIKKIKKGEIGYK